MSDVLLLSSFSLFSSSQVTFCDNKKTHLYLIIIINIMILLKRRVVVIVHFAAQQNAMPRCCFMVGNITSAQQTDYTLNKMIMIMMIILLMLAKEVVVKMMSIFICGASTHKVCSTCMHFFLPLKNQKGVFWNSMLPDIKGVRWKIIVHLKKCDV